MRRRQNVFVPILLVAAAVAVSAIGGVSSKLTAAGGDLSAEPPKLLEPGSGARVVNGTTVSPETFTARWPFLVAILDARVAGGQFNQQICAGALVTPTLVLTAAHCVEGITAGNLRVLSGTDYLSNTWSSQLLQVSVITAQPTYDVAVLTLQAPSSAATIEAVGPGEDAIWGAGRGVTADPARGPWFAGWGNTARGDGAGSYPQQPREVNVPVVSDATCASGTKGWGTQFDAGKHVCAGLVGSAAAGYVDSKGGCDADSGGPLIASANGAWRVVGVLSFGETGCRGSVADGFVRVAAIRDWLQAQGVPVGTGTVAGPLPSPDTTVTGGGAGGAAITLTAPRDRIAVSSLGGKVRLRWTVRDDLRVDRLVIRQGSRQVFSGSAAGTIGIDLDDRGFRAGNYAWCVTAVDAAGQPAGEACRTIVRRGAHLAQLTSARWRGGKGTFSGLVASSATRVSVTVKVLAGRRTVASSRRIAVRPRPGAAGTRFSFRSSVPRDLRASRITAVVTVSGGGATKTFRNTLR